MWSHPWGVIALRIKPSRDQPGKLEWPGAPPWDLSPGLSSQLTELQLPRLLPPLCCSVWDILPLGPQGIGAFLPLRSATSSERPSPPVTMEPPPPVSIPADTTPITLLRSLLSARVLLSLSRLKATGRWGPCMFWSPPYTQRPARGLARSRCSKIIRRTD